MSTTASPIITPDASIFLHDAHWTPESTLGSAPQTGFNAIAGPAPAWVFAGGCLTQIFDGSPVCEVTPAAAATMTMQTVGATFQPPVYRTSQPAGDLELSPICRALFRFRRRVVGGAPGGGFGVEMRCVASTVGASVGGGTGAGFALCMNGVGGWNLIARQQIGGAVTLTQPIVWPNGDTQYTTWEFRILPATGTTDAIFQLLANGGVVFSQAWAVAPFADYTGAGAPYRFGLSVNAGPVGPTDSLLVRAVRIIQASAVS